MAAWLSAARREAPPRQSDAAAAAAALTMYADMPEGDLSLEEFEGFAVERLRLLKALEAAKARGKRDDELKATLKTLVERHIGGATPAESARADEFGHHILRIAYSRSEELRRWLTTHETMLFKLRFRHTLSSTEHERFLSSNNLPYEPCSNAELNDVRDDVAQLLEVTGKREEAALVRNATPSTASARRAYYKVPFEEVPDLVATRSVVLNGGHAYVPAEGLVSLVAGHFRARLAKALAQTNRALAGGAWADEAHRIAPIAAGLAQRYLGPAVDGADGAANNQQLRVSDLPKMATEHFPLCMLTLFQAVRRDAHLRHGGRQQLSLFLKSIGLRLEDALAFWKGEFTRKITGEDFDKRYAYNIRHNYGKEGKRTDYTPHSCAKCIASTVGAVGEYHGCPYRTQSKNQLMESLKENLKLAPAQALEVAEKASAGHYQLACGRALELRRGIELEDNVMLPHQYYTMSKAAAEGGEAAAMELDSAAPPVTPAATRTAPALTAA